MSKAKHSVGFMLVTGSAVAWSLGGLFTRLVPVDSWTMLAWRGLFGALGLALAMAVLRERAILHTLRRMSWIGWAYTIQSAAGMTFYLSALRHTSVANVAVIYATAPFMAAALGWLTLRERPTRSAMVASGIALCGVVIMVGSGTRGGLLGDVLALGMTSSMATTTVVARNYPGIPILLTACISSLLSGLIAWPFGSPLGVTAGEMGVLALFGLVNFAIGLPLFTFGARLLPPIETALIGALDAPLAPLWVWLAFRETPRPGTLIGGAVVFTAVAVHLWVGAANTEVVPVSSKS